MENKKLLNPDLNKLLFAGAILGSAALLAACSSKKENTINITPGLTAQLKAGHEIVFMHDDMLNYLHDHGRTILTVTLINREGIQQIILSNGQSIASSNAAVDTAGDLALDCLPILPKEECDIIVDRKVESMSHKKITSYHKEIHIRPSDEYLQPSGTNV